jgi:tetratricopeptide (TPR) repeat protein
VDKGIPGWLLAPPQQQPSPPVSTASQTLPFADLSWEDFERLCLRLARIDGMPAHVQLYGVRGQDQSGIDIYSRGRDGTYAVYQCKRYQRIRPVDIAGAVETFLGRAWARRARRFVLCTASSLTATSLAEEVERQARRLAAADPPVEFVIWDSEGLAAQLRKHPEIVQDFFGQAWLERFLPRVAQAIPRPQQLPPPPLGFVNRDVELERLTALVQAGSLDGGPRVVVLSGSHGVGKSAISRQWAHVYRDLFTDGQLYADFSELRYRGGASSGDVLARFLRALGVHNEDIPVELGERAALFRSSTAGKRLLIVLDEVDYAAQVTPLVPSAGQSAVLVTSRDPLAELLREGSSRLHLSPLESRAARELLARVVDEGRLDAEPEAVERLVEICAGLPVALRVCGALLAARDRRPVSWLVDELNPEAHRLSRLGLSQERSLQVVFDEAYARLTNDGACAYRRLGLHPGPSFRRPAAAAVADLPPARVSAALDELVEANLVEETSEGFRFHDLLRLHARMTCERVETATERLEALDRVVRFYLRAAQRMDHAMIADRLRLTDGPPAAGFDEPVFATASQAFDWFERERANLVNALRLAYEHEWDEVGWQMGEALFLAYHNHKHFDEAREVHELATNAAARVGDVDAEARTRSQLGRALLDLGDFEGAARELAAAERLMRASSNEALAASIIEWTGVLESDRGNYPEAIAAFKRARAIFQKVGETRGVALQDYHLGRSLDLAGRHREAIARLQQAAAGVNRGSDSLTLGRILLRLGEAYRSLGDVDRATPILEEAAVVMHEIGASFYEALARESLARVARSRGAESLAREHLLEALAIYKQLRSPRAERVSLLLAAATSA